MIRSSEGIEVPANLAEWCDPSRVALVVYDMQVGICRQVAGAADIVERTGIVLEAARSAGMRVAFTRHLSLPRKWMGATQLRTAMAWQRHDSPDTVEPWFLRDAEATQIVPELAPRADEAVFDKLTMSAFDSTALGFALGDCGVRAIALAGIAMEIGIEPTARHAADLGIVPVIVEDACGGGHAEAAQRSVESLKFAGDAVFTNSDAFIRAIQHKRG